MHQFLKLFVISQSITEQINTGSMEPWLFIFSSGSEYDESFLELKKISALVPNVEVIILFAFLFQFIFPFLI